MRGEFGWCVVRKLNTLVCKQLEFLNNHTSHMTCSSTGTGALGHTPDITEHKFHLWPALVLQNLFSSNVTYVFMYVNVCVCVSFSGRLVVLEFLLSLSPTHSLSSLSLLHYRSCVFCSSRGLAFTSTLLQGRGGAPSRPSYPG